MTTTNTPGKVSPLFIALAAVTVALSSWGLYSLFTTFAGMPPQLALLAVGGLDIVAVLCGKHALTVASDGDSSGPWNLLLLAFTGLAAFAQFSHAMLEGWPFVVGVTMAAFPVATVILFEGQLRRKARLEGRARGLVPAPRASVPLIMWVFWPRVALQATRLAARDRSLTADDAFLVAEEERKAHLAQTLPQGRLPRFVRTYPALEAAVVQEPAVEDQSLRTWAMGEKGSVAETVRRVRAEVQDDSDVSEILARVRMIHPDAKEDTVLRTLRRTNGATPAHA